MIDFSTVKPVSDDKYSFVGLQRKKGDLCFYLPRGYSTDVTPAEMRTLFFFLYKALRCFVQEAPLHHSKRARGRVEPAADRDGVLQSERVEETALADGRDTFGYAPMVRLDALLDAFDEMAVSTLAQRKTRVDEPDWDRMEGVMDAATFLPEGEMMVDEPMGERAMAVRLPIRMVSLYCYLYAEVMREMGEGDNLRADVAALAADIRERENLPEGALFGVGTAEHTLERLCDLFARCDATSSVKDEEYFLFRDACANFLFGSAPGTGETEEPIWGMKEFWPFWEALVVARACRSPETSGVLYVDPDAAFPPLHPNTLDFAEAVDGNRRPLFPDCVVGRNPQIVLTPVDFDDFTRHLRAHVALDPVGSHGSVLARVGFKDANNGQRVIHNRLTDHRKGDKYVVTLADLRALPVISVVGSVDSEPVPTPGYFFMACALNDLFLKAWEDNIAEKAFVGKLAEYCEAPNTKFHLAFVRAFCGRDDAESSDDTKIEAVRRYERRRQFYDRHRDAIALAKSTLQAPFAIVDAKNEALADLVGGKDFAATMNADVRKQLVYEWLLDKKGHPRAQSEFWVPGQTEAIHISSEATSIWQHVRLRTVNPVLAADDYVVLMRQGRGMARL